MHKFARISALVAILTWAGSAESEETFDLILSNGYVFDGTGAPAILTDVGIRDDVIAEIGDLSEADAVKRVDVSGRTVVPGFIDLHSHADGASPSGGLRSYSAKRRAAPNLVAQGVTTVVVNQDGRSPLDIDRQRSDILNAGIGPNAILMIGHNTVRRAVMRDNYQRAATDEEIDAMARFVRRGMDNGAFGLTAGLEYVPGIWSTTQELIGLVGQLEPYDGVYIVHERSSGSHPMWFLPSQHDDHQPDMLDSIIESVTISEITGVRTVATHIKARGADYWGSSEEIIETVRRARERGVPIWADQYPYTTSGSDGLMVLLPYWILGVNDGEVRDYADSLRAALSDPVRAERLREDIAHEMKRRGGAEHIYVLEHPNRDYIGLSLETIATQRETTPVEIAIAFQFEGYRNRFGGVRVRGFSLDEHDVIAFMEEPWVATASDAGIALPEDGPVHPRHYGTFPRKLREYVIDRGEVGLGQALRSMTSLPAEILGLPRRGHLKIGYVADIAVIDLDRIRDLATFFNPHQYPTGIDYVFVNGEMVVDQGTLTWALPGRVLTPERTTDTD